MSDGPNSKVDYFDKNFFYRKIVSENNSEPNKSININKIIIILIIIESRKSSISTLNNEEIKLKTEEKLNELEYKSNQLSESKRKSQIQ